MAEIKKKLTDISEEHHAGSITFTANTKLVEDWMNEEYGESVLVFKIPGEKRAADEFRHKATIKGFMVSEPKIVPFEAEPPQPGEE